MDIEEIEYQPKIKDEFELYAYRMDMYMNIK